MNYDFYGEPGCCLTCDAEWKNDHLLEPDTESDIEQTGDCLCTICKCRKCSWYRSNISEDEYDASGYCTHPAKKGIDIDDLEYSPDDSD
jgi:hypothetical protein